MFGDLNKVIISVVGNSISTGFSLVYNTKPFLERNIWLKDVLKKENIELKTYSFARPQDNNDEHIYRALVRNMKLSEINKKIQIDLSNHKRAMSRYHISDEDLQKYFSSNIKEDIGLKDVIKINQYGLANIVIYNGLTGSFLDVLTHKGNLLHAFKAFDRDLDNFKAFLKYVYLVNPSTQVYVCGVPNILGIGLFRRINNKAKKECFNYPNVTYVDSVKTKFIYSKNGKYHVDIHYDDDEYLKMNVNIFNSIGSNYKKNMLFTEFDNALHRYQDNIDVSMDDLFISLHEITFIYKELFDMKVYKELVKFYKLRYPFDYYYSPKEQVINFLKIKENYSI